MKCEVCDNTSPVEEFFIKAQFKGLQKNACPACLEKLHLQSGRRQLIILFILLVAGLTIHFLSPESKWGWYILNGVSLLLAFAISLFVHKQLII